MIAKTIEGTTSNAGSIDIASSKQAVRAFIAYCYMALLLVLLLLPCLKELLNVKKW